MRPQAAWNLHFFRFICRNKLEATNLTPPFPEHYKQERFRPLLLLRAFSIFCSTACGRMATNRREPNDRRRNIQQSRAL
jgi:hypothetical protein